MRNRIAFWPVALVLAFAVLLAGGDAIAAPARQGHAVVIALDGPISPASAAYVVRALQEAEQSHAAIAILRMDTPGGLDTAMRSIIRAMLASPVPVAAYVAPSGARAASAGTYILYASALAAMAPGTNLGAATPVSLFGPTNLPGPQRQPGGEAGKDSRPAPSGPPQEAELVKITNDSAAYIRGLAIMHHRNAEWAERAVREAVSLPYDGALAEHVIDLAASDVPELLAEADGRVVIVQGREMRLATKGLQVTEIAPGWRERLLATLTDPEVVYLLLLAGLAGIAFELSHPGVIAPGVIGTICLLISGYGLNLLPIDYAGLALLLLGIGLMVTEAFIPAFGALVLGGAAAFAIGSVMMFDVPGLRPPTGLIAAATAGSALFFGVVLTMLLRVRRRPVVSGEAALIGAGGRVLQWAGLKGDILAQGERWSARASRPLAPGEPVRIVGREGLTLLVEPTAVSTHVEPL
ncbi:MAG: nodulation protein NfeD [Acetobacteraceae bacterium]|nr:nodulation protein NfeD [Acetobacteraceae bacterium]